MTNSAHTNDAGKTLRNTGVFKLEYRSFLAQSQLRNGDDRIEYLQRFFTNSMQLDEMSKLLDFPHAPNPSSLLVEAHEILDILLGSKESRQSLMDPGRLNVQDPLSSSCCQSSSLFRQESHGERFVKDSQLSI
jgi:hypothetical protein